MASIAYVRRPSIAALLAAFACTGEPVYRMPSFPTTLHMGELSAEDENAALEAASRWDVARGEKMFARATRTDRTSCGVYVERGAEVTTHSKTAGGLHRIFADCKALVMLRQDLSRERVLPVIMHEFGHILRGDGTHNPDARSVLHSRAGDEILPDDVECTKPPGVAACSR